MLIGFLPHTHVGIAASRLAPAVMERTGARGLIVISALLSAVGFLWQSSISTDSGYLDGLLGPAIVLSAGMACSSPRSRPPSPPASASGTQERPPG